MMMRSLPVREQVGLAVARNRRLESLAERANLTADYVGFVERGENVPTLTVILKLALALNCPPADLLAGFTLPAVRRLFK